MNAVRGFGVWCARAVSLIVFSACRLLEGLESELEMVSFIAVGKCVTVILDHEYLVPLQLLRPQVSGSIKRVLRVGLPGGKLQFGRFKTYNIHCPWPTS